MYPWDRPKLFVWMGLDAPEVREIALREDGIRQPMGEPMEVYLNLYYRACPVCGRMQHTLSADPWHPEPGSTVEAASQDANAMAAVHRDRVRVEIVPPDPWDADKDVCEMCKDAWTRAPEVMSVVRNMIHMAAYEREELARKATGEDA
jgi:hypothetical protein